MAEPLNIVCPHCDGVNRAPVERLAQGPKCGRCKQALFTGEPVALDGPRLQTHINRSDIPLIIDFWAGWCGPCKSMAPIFERAARTMEPRARFIKVDVDANPAAAKQFAVQGIPALFAVRGGKVAAQQSGVADTQFLKGWVDRFSQVKAAS